MWWRTASTVSERPGYGSRAVATISRPLSVPEWMLCAAAYAGGVDFDTMLPRRPLRTRPNENRTDQRKCTVEGVWELEARHAFMVRSDAPTVEGNTSARRTRTEGQGGQASRQSADLEAATPATTQSISEGRGNGRGGEMVMQSAAQGGFCRMDESGLRANLVVSFLCVFCFCSWMMGSRRKDSPI